MLIKNMLVNKNYLEKKIPIWFMRQAGRYLPEYRKIRKSKKKFLDLCFAPQLAAEISLQPINRFDFDAIILFSDILVVPLALGQKVDFHEGRGPILDPIIDSKNLIIDESRWREVLSPIFKTISILSQKKENKTLIGFCGSPFTVFTYMIEGGTSKDHFITKRYIIENPIQTKKIIDKLVDISIWYLNEQIKHGADIIQLFDSWSGILDGELHDALIINPNKRIINKVKEKNKNTPIIFFPKGSSLKYQKIVSNIDLDGLSLDLDVQDRDLNMLIQKKIVLQGNLDPVRLLVGGQQLEKSVIQILERFKKKKFIFNLSHGILPQTPIINVERTIELVRNYEYSN